MFDAVDDPTTSRMLLRYHEGDLDKSHLRQINDLLESGDMDQADVQRMMGMLGRSQFPIPCRKPISEKPSTMR